MDDLAKRRLLERFGLIGDGVPKPEYERLPLREMPLEPMARALNDAADLVQRLRERGQGQEMFGFDGMLDDGDPLLIEAANKIVRLRSHILAGLQREASFAEQVEKQDDEIERLSAQLAERDRDAERWRNK